MATECLSVSLSYLSGAMKRFDHRETYCFVSYEDMASADSALKELQDASVGTSKSAPPHHIPHYTATRACQPTNQSTTGGSSPHNMAFHHACPPYFQLTAWLD